jgi:hypothetical protein
VIIWEFGMEEVCFAKVDGYSLIKIATEDIE